MCRNGCKLQAAARQKRAFLHHSALNIDFMKVLTFFPPLLLEDTLIFPFDCVFPQTQEKERGSLVLMHRLFHKQKRKGSQNRRVWGRSSQGHGVRSCDTGLPPSCSAAGRRGRRGRTGVFFFFLNLLNIAIRFLLLQRPWKRMGNSLMCVRVTVQLRLTYFHALTPGCYFRLTCVTAHRHKETVA